MQQIHFGEYNISVGQFSSTLIFFYMARRTNTPRKQNILMKHLFGKVPQPYTEFDQPSPVKVVDEPVHYYYPAGNDFSSVQEAETASKLAIGRMFRMMDGGDLPYCKDTMDNIVDIVKRAGEYLQIRGQLGNNF